MGLSAVIEIEEGVLICTVATVTRRAIQVAHSVRVPFPECSAANFANTLRSLREQVAQPFDGVHVLLGDRRVQHFVMKVPPLDSRELVEFVQRECARQTGASNVADLAVYARLRGRLPGRMRRLGVVAAPMQLLEPLMRGSREAGVKLLSINSIETGIAGVLGPKSPERVAMLDFTHGKARFLVCENGLPGHLRRFLVHGADGERGDQAMLAAQLAMEVPRTLDFLRDQGCEPPTSLWIGHRIAIGADEQALFASEVADVQMFAPACRLADGLEMPNLATVGLLSLLQRGGTLPNLEQGLVVEQPRRPLQMFVRAAAAAALVAGGAFGWHEQQQARDLQRQRDQIAQDRASVHEQLALLGHAAPTTETEDPEVARQRKVLATRRPISLALEAICGASESPLHLDNVRFVDADHIAVEGGVQADSRIAALQAIGDFGERLRAVPFLLREGSEEVRDDGVQGHMHFRFELNWRRP